MYNLDGIENDLFLFSKGNTAKRCGECGVLADKWSIDAAGLQLDAIPDGDVTRTLDGALIVSERFRDVYAINSMSGLEFRPVGDKLYWVVASTVIEYDAGAGHAKFSGRCKLCGRFELVSAATHHVRNTNTIGELSFARTDVEVGFRDEQAPLIVCRQSVVEVLRRSSLRMYVAEPVVETSDECDVDRMAVAPRHDYEALAAHWQFEVIQLLRAQLKKHKVKDKKAKEIAGDFVFALSMLHDEGGLEVDDESYTPRLSFVDPKGELVTSNGASNLHDYALGNVDAAYGDEEYS